MCGIVAYTGEKNGKSVILGGLKKLEYRGYDSAGLAYALNGKTGVLKSAGKVKNLEELASKADINSSCMLGHTRWATHGKPSAANSHPHTGNGEDIALVHNGIIENYQEIKRKLTLKGHKFKSQTDSEVAAHLIEEEIKRTASFETAFVNSVSKLKGAYAIAAMYSKEPGVLMAAKKQSPLVLGVGKREFYLASDVPAFLEHTKKAIFLNDGDIVKVSPNGYEIKDINGKEVKRSAQIIKWNASTAEKGGFKHFMLKEIFDQPQAVEDTLRTLPPDIKKAFGICASQAKKIKGIYIVACGTAYHASLAAKYFIEHFTRLPVEVETASEFKYRDINFKKEWLFIAVSQSGETADTLAALTNAKNADLKSLGICNVMGSAITRESDYTVYTRCGPEISVASTKAFTSQLVALYSLAVNLAYSRGALKKENFKRIYEEFYRLPSLFAKILDNAGQIKALAKRVYKRPSFIFLGRNACYPIALEGALKLKEISYLHAEGFAGGEIKHGPIAIIERGMPVVAVSPKGKLYEKMLSSCQEVSARGANLILITNALSTAKNAVILPDTSEYLFPLLAALPLQLFAYYIAALRGREIDQPRNLAKSVTVE
jgi:glucosamine--fructose-6-phosphate aminotransferase (isomerizing)